MTSTEDLSALKQRLRNELHHMSQPLTVLQCRLELGRMMGNQASLIEAVLSADDEIRRLFASMATMRALVVDADEI